MNQVHSKRLQKLAAFYYANVCYPPLNPPPVRGTFAKSKHRLIFRLLQTDIK
jgi:hypothetical protein